MFDISDIVLTQKFLQQLRKVATIESIGASTRLAGSDLSDYDIAQLLSKLEILQMDHKISDGKLFLHMPEVSAQIMTLLDKHGRLTISQFEKMSNLNRNTLKKHVSSLVADKQILRHGKGKACWYTLP